MGHPCLVICRMSEAIDGKSAGSSWKSTSGASWNVSIPALLAGKNSSPLRGSSLQSPLPPPFVDNISQECPVLWACIKESPVNSASGHGSVTRWLNGSIAMTLTIKRWFYGSIAITVIVKRWFDGSIAKSFFFVYFVHSLVVRHRPSLLFLVGRKDSGGNLLFSLFLAFRRCGKPNQIKRWFIFHCT